MSTDRPSLQPDSFGWALNRLADKVVGIRYLAVTSADGLLVVDAVPTDADIAPYRRINEHYAASITGCLSLLNAAAAQVDGGELRLMHVSMDKALILACMIDDHARLAALADPGTDLGALGYEMTTFVDQFGHVLTPELRQRLNPTVTATRVALP